VPDLHVAVEKLTQAGFNVEYGKRIESAYNAMIWLEDNVFVEIYQTNGLSFATKLFMKLFGYSSILKRMEKWNRVNNGWCEWSIESPDLDLKPEERVFKRLMVGYTKHHGKRRNILGTKLSWHLIFPKDIRQPFLMSAYSPDPRPARIEHPNGIHRVKYIIVGGKTLNLPLFAELELDWNGIKIDNNTLGVQTVVFEGSDLRIEDILKDDSTLSVLK
jgi:hypothetical protein